MATYYVTYQVKTKGEKPVFMGRQAYVKADSPEEIEKKVMKSLSKDLELASLGHIEESTHQVIV